MEIEDVKKVQKKEIVMTIRTTKEKSEWMRKHNISPSMLFDKALEELMEKHSIRENYSSDMGQSVGKVTDSFTAKLIGRRR